MEAWAREVLDLWTGNRLRLAELLLEAMENNPDMPVKGYKVEDLLQMVDGGAAMIAEQIAGQGNEIRETYMNSVVPGLLAQGQPLTSFVGQMTMNSVILHGFLVPRASETNRAQIATYLLNFFTRFNSDVVKVGLEFHGVKL